MPVGGRQRAKNLNTVKSCDIYLTICDQRGDEFIADTIWSRIRSLTAVVQLIGQIGLHHNACSTAGPEFYGPNNSVAHAVRRYAGEKTFMLSWIAPKKIVPLKYAGVEKMPPASASSICW